jgi:hypothetical protein
VLSDDKLREVYEQIASRRAAGKRTHCIPPDDLLALAERRITGSRRLEMLDHVMRCGACREEFELLRAIREARKTIERQGDRGAE